MFLLFLTIYILEQEPSELYDSSKGANLDKISQTEAAVVAIFFEPIVLEVISSLL